jgi:molecular chaperone GrpE
MKKRPPFTSPLLFPDADDPEFSQHAAHGYGFEGSGDTSATEQAHRESKAEHRAQEAYAAQDDLSSISPERKGPLGGLFTHTARHKEEPAQQAVDIDDATLVEMCKQRVCPDCPVKKEADDAQLRAMAELDNARKRLAREREEQIRFAAESVLSDIIPSLDNLELALQHVEGNEACKDFATGVRMTRNLMLEALKKHGLQSAGRVGEEFDPALHEAVGMADVEDVPDGYVCGMLSQGYTLNGRLLRPARVMVCKKKQ